MKFEKNVNIMIISKRKKSKSNNEIRKIIKKIADEKEKKF